MKKVIAAIIIMTGLLITFFCSSSFVVGRVEEALSLTDDAISDIENGDYDSALEKLNSLKSEMDDTAPTLQKILVHENVEEIMRSIDEAIIYCKYNVKTEAIKELVGAQYLLDQLKEIEVFSLRTIF